LPLLYTLWHGNEAQAQLVHRAIQKGGREEIAAVIQAIESTGAIAYTAKRARSEAQCAQQMLEALAPSAYKDALLALADFAVNRAS
jgi:octaprenyl-diphosphate synthase